MNASSRRTRGKDGNPRMALQSARQCRHAWQSRLVCSQILDDAVRHVYIVTGPEYKHTLHMSVEKIPRH